MFSQIEKDLQILDANLKQMAGPRNAVLHAATEHLFYAGGKRIRPLIVLLVAQATNKNKIKNEHRRLAEITEIIHTASLLHDDVIDDCKIRRGSATVNNEFSNKVAILAGDFLFAQSSWYLANLNNLEVVKIISKVITDFAEGEVSQNSTRFDLSMSIDEYINKSFYKTASLLASSCKASAILSDADINTQNKFYDYGKHLGLAFQIIDDILDIEGKDTNIGKPTGLDLRNGNLTAPLLFALHECPKLKTLITREFEEEKDIEYAIHLIKSTNGIKLAKDLAIEYAQTSIQNIRDDLNNESLNALESVCNYILYRNI